MQKPIIISPGDRVALALVKKLLEADLAIAPSLKELCRKAGINEDKLKKGFKYMYKLPPHTYHRQLKMEEAKRMLLEKEKNVNEIAWILGYEYASNFSTEFMKYCGCTPVRYRFNHS